MCIDTLSDLNLVYLLAPNIIYINQSKLEFKASLVTNSKENKFKTSIKQQFNLQANFELLSLSLNWRHHLAIILFIDSTNITMINTIHLLIGIITTILTIVNGLPITDYPFDQVPVPFLHISSKIPNLTRGLPIKPIHSHNDYWRQQPLFTALALGITSVEADVWSFQHVLGDPKIYVGHHMISLNGLRTLQTLYLEPIYKMLDERNSKMSLDLDVDERTIKIKDEEVNYQNWTGLFDIDPTQTLNLLIDFKTEGEPTYDAVYAALTPLRAKGWLTTFDQETQTLIPGPVTIIGTGKTPLQRVLDEVKRDIFFDAPLDSLTDESKNDENKVYTKEVSPLASCALAKIIEGHVDFHGLDEDQYETVKSHIEEAHRRGLKTRVWDTPTFPVERETAVWRQLVSMNTDYLNADNLELGVRYV
ncbi:unnamed protein product [Ambrosiozyma monospora]|uniref:Altered inheritance of mitochondria protein 6 n=1 Tax=Ambrosiozyma monospora TaxID=43982 RepID=A0A9W6YVA4_AMBMO|nr:unnamed protein product [Ambrosiozyma monospora]